MTHQTTVIPHYNLYKLVVISPLLVVKNVIAGYSSQTPKCLYSNTSACVLPTSLLLPVGFFASVFQLLEVISAFDTRLHLLPSVPVLQLLIHVLIVYKEGGHILIIQTKYQEIT